MIINSFVRFLFCLVIAPSRGTLAWISLDRTLAPPNHHHQESFSRNKVALSVFQGFDIGSIFAGSALTNKTDKDAKEQRERLKSELLQVCRQPKVKRSDVEQAIAALAPLAPVKETAASPLLQKDWLLTWTTEKEINFFLDFGLASEVSQTINGNDLGNLIAFKRGGGLSVTGSLSVPDAKGVRTEFKFDTATLDLDKWGKYEFPPVGEGWFDTVYLDDSLRVDTNSRDDILICTPRA